MKRIKEFISDFKTIKKTIFYLSITSFAFYLIYRLPSNIESYLIEQQIICAPEKNYFFKIKKGTKFQIEDKTIVTFNFKEKNYTDLPELKHIYLEDDEKEEIKNNKEAPYEYVLLDKNRVFEVVDCHTKITTGISHLIVQSSEQERYAISQFVFKKLRLNRITPTK